MAFTFNDIIDIEDKLVEKFLKNGYPSDSLIQGWKIDSKSRADLVIVDVNTGIPLIMIDVKVCAKKDRENSINKAFKNLKEYYIKQKFQIKYVAAIYTDEESRYEFIDLTKAVMENNLNNHISLYSIPSYEFLTAGARQKAIKAEKDKQDNRILLFKILCWIVIPIIVIALLILDAKGIYVFSTLRLIVIGSCVGVALLPCFKEIKIGEVYIKNISDNKKYEV